MASTNELQPFRSFIFQTLLILSSLFFSTKTFSQEYIPIWPEGKMPNTKGMKLERIEERERVSQIDIPGMYAFFTSNEENKGSAVLIFPPGGYAKLTYNIAGLQIAKWLNTIGINAFVLMHRLPTSPDLVHRELGSIQDAQRALKMIRQNATKWNIDPEKIGVFGASAGGHVATTISTIATDHSQIDDELNGISYLPNFQILVSPVVSLTQDFHQGSRDNLLGKDASKALALQYSNEKNVSSKTPPAFLVHAHNDPVVSPLNSLHYYQALQTNGINASIHIFPNGGHSIALRNNPGSTNQWTDLCEAWLVEMGFL